MLINAASLTVATLKGGADKEGTPVQGGPMRINGGNEDYRHSTWTFNAVDQTVAPVWYTLKNLAGGTFLSTEGGRNVSGTKLVGTRDATLTSTQWSVTEVTGQTATCYV